MKVYGTLQFTMYNAAESRGYTLLDAAPYRFDDQYTRQVFSSTVARANF